jgi:cell division protein FtsB
MTDTIVPYDTVAERLASAEARLKVYEIEIEFLKGHIADLRADRNFWRKYATTGFNDDFDKCGAGGTD